MMTLFTDIGMLLVYVGVPVGLPLYAHVLFRDCPEISIATKRPNIRNGIAVHFSMRCTCVITLAMLERKAPAR